MPALDQKLREFVSDNFLYGQEGAGFGNDESFLELGLIDSTGVLELVSYLENEFALEVRDEELVPTNLDSIDALVRFIETKLEETKGLV